MTVTLIDGKVAVQRAGKVGHVTMLPFQRVTIADGTESITRVMELLKFSSMIDYRIEGSHIYIRSSSHRS